MYVVYSTLHTMYKTPVKSTYIPLLDVILVDVYVHL